MSLSVSVDRTTIQDVTAVTVDHQSFLVQWTHLASTDLTGFVVEWRPMLKENLSHVHFEKVDKNQTNLILAGMDMLLMYLITSIQATTSNEKFM